MKPTINCENLNPVVPHWESDHWELISLGEANASDTPYFQYASSTCQATGTPETINGFTYGEVFICFMLLIFSMALIFNFLFKNFIKNI
jgi:hypothetical protein